MQLIRAPRKPIGELTTVIAEGRKGMPAWKTRLKPDEIEAVARYVQQLNP